MDHLQRYSSLAIFLDETGTECGVAGLVATGTGLDTGMLDIVAAPDVHSRQVVRRTVPQVVRAAFQGAPVRHLYHDRFDDDPDLLSGMDVWELEVTLPEFAQVNGRYADRLTFGLSRSEYEQWVSHGPDRKAT